MAMVNQMRHQQGPVHLNGKLIEILFLAAFKKILQLKAKQFEDYLIKRLQRLIRMRLIMVTIVSLKELSTLRTPKSVGGKLLPQSRATRKRPSKTSLTPA
jgi:hypothetical protein